MKSESPNETDQFVTFSRRGLWAALTVTLTLALIALGVNVFPNSGASDAFTNVMRLLPIGIAVAIAFICIPFKTGHIRMNGKVAHVVLNDELRQYALNRAYRNGFFVALLTQPVLLVLFVLQPLPNAAALMAGATSFVCSGTVLGSILWYDRQE